MRMPRMHGWPFIWFGFQVIRSKFSIGLNFADCEQSVHGRARFEQSAPIRGCACGEECQPNRASGLQKARTRIDDRHTGTAAEVWH